MTEKHTECERCGEMADALRNALDGMGSVAETLAIVVNQLRREIAALDHSDD